MNQQEKARRRIWRDYSQPFVRIELPQLRGLQFEHAHSEIRRNRHGELQGGYSVWLSEFERRPAYLAWNWLPLQWRMLWIEQATEVRSNLMPLDCEGCLLPPEQAQLVWLACVHKLDWQTVIWQLDGTAGVTSGLLPDTIIAAHGLSPPG